MRSSAAAHLRDSADARSCACRAASLASCRSRASCMVSPRETISSCADMAGSPRVSSASLSSLTSRCSRVVSRFCTRIASCSCASRPSSHAQRRSLRASLSWLFPVLPLPEDAFNPDRCPAE
eukprot:scaffold104970_cov32-Tisochrysis_lutea.AAC.3